MSICSPRQRWRASASGPGTVDLPRRPAAWAWPRRPPPNRTGRTRDPRDTRRVWVAGVGSRPSVTAPFALPLPVTREVILSAVRRCRIISEDRLGFTPGTHLDVYEVTAQIGEGGMRQVYRAPDTTLHRDVALKVLPDAFASDSERLARFNCGAQVLASLNHPNIAHIHGLEE